MALRHCCCSSVWAMSIQGGMVPAAATCNAQNCSAHDCLIEFWPLWPKQRIPATGLASLPTARLQLVEQGVLPPQYA
jgi:hypothetical protein